MGKIAIADGQANSSATHTMLEKSSTLNRKYVKRPKAVRTAVAKNAPTSAAKAMASASASAKVTKTATAKAAKPAPTARAMSAAKSAPKTRKAASERVSMKKSAQDTAAKSAMRSLAKMNDDAPTMKAKRKPHRIALAFACSAITVLGLFFFVQTNMPDITVKVTAMQTGIDAVYPSYIPRNYSFGDAISEKDGSITMSFNGPEGASFTLTEEKSTWDSTALLNNYVKGNFSSDYSTVRERGITVYIDQGDATWVNGGILYKVKSEIRRLTKEQIVNLVSSL